MRNFLLTIIFYIALMPLSLMAQDQANPFKGYYMLQAKENASTQAKVTAALLCKKYSIDVTMEKSLYKVIYQGMLEIEQTTIQYAKTPELEGHLAEVIAKNDSVTQIILKAAKSKSLANNKTPQPKGNSKFAVAVRLKNELSLSQVQVDSLMYHINCLNKLRLVNGVFNPRDYEQQVLPKILKDGQYTSLLVNINKVPALKNAQSDWKELKQRGLLTGADSTKVVNEILTYNIGKSSVKDRYSNATLQLSESMKALVTPEPQATTLLKRARRFNNPLSDTQKPTFTW